MQTFNLLSNESSEMDYSVDKTHENISKQLNDLIVNDNEHDLTIGLEGSWGSGKSTVVKLLGNKLEKNNGFFYFYIDAWAHEGDHLRRIFLEKLVDTIKKKYAEEKYTKKKDIITSIENEIHYKQKTTLISKLPEINIPGKISGALAFCIPIGTVILEKTIDEVTIGFGLPFHKTFILGLSLTLAPLISIIITVLLGFILGFFKNKSDKIKKFCENMSFFKSTDTDTTTETTNEVEKSSVDFEKLFDRIGKEILFPKYKKFICVIDNLDRINETDALKIWSTLQTFIQKEKNNDTLQKIFIIPYDESGLQKLWDKDGKYIKGYKYGKNACSKSFFDKSFQLRIEVPPFSLSGWEQFTLSCLSKAFPEEDDDFRKTIFNVLKWTRNDLYDALSPREIKNYINQIGFLYPLFEDKVSLTSLCYYTVIRFIDNKSIEEIKKGLIASSIPENKMRIYSKFDELSQELSAILYNVSKEKGMELLLRDPIIKSIQKDDSGENLITIQEKHKTIFNSVIYNILLNTEISNLSNYFIILYDTFKNDFDLCKMLCDFIKSRNTEIINCLPTYKHKANINIFKITKIHDIEVFKSFLKPYEDLFVKTLLTEGPDPVEVVSNFIEVKDLYPELKINYLEIGYTGILKLLPYCNDVERKQKISECIINLGNIDEHVSNNIQETAQTIDPNIPKVIELVSIKNPLTNWTNTLAKIIYIIQRNPLKTFAPYSALLALQLCKLGEEENSKIQNLIHTDRFWHNLYNFTGDEEFFKCSYLLTKYTDLATNSITNNGNSITCFNTLFKYIISDDSNELENVFYFYCFQSKDFSCIWKLSKQTKYKLFKNIIEYVMKNDFSIFNDLNNLLEKFSDALRFYEEKTEKELIFKYFEKQTKFINSIINNEKEYLRFPEACLFILDETGDKTIKDKIMQEMAEYEKSQWDTIFASNNAVLKIISYFAKNSIRINGLKNNYCDSFTDLIISCIKNKQNCPIDEDLQINCYDVLSDSFQKDLSDKVANEILANKFLIQDSVKNFCIAHINYQSCIKNKSSEICEIIEEYVDTNKPNNLIIIQYIISRYKSSFIPDERYKDTLSEPFMKMKNTVNEADRQVIIELASYFSINLD